MELVPLYERDFCMYIRSNMADIVEEGADGISDYEEDDLHEMAQRHSL